MASATIHLTRLANALAENERSLIPTKTIIDGALRPLTAKQRKALQDLVHFPESLEKAKQLHQMKIKRVYDSVAYTSGTSLSAGNVFANVKPVNNE